MSASRSGPPIHPRRLWYWLAGCLLAGAATCIALGIAGFFGMVHQVQDFQRVSVPGHATVTFSQRGQYDLYLERPGSCCSFDVGSGSGHGDGAPFPGWAMNVELLPVAGGPAVSLSTWRGATESYGAAGHQGQAAMSFTIARPGRYYLAARAVTPRSITDLAVGRGIGRGVLIRLLLLLIGILVLTPAGLLVGGITVGRRHRARRAAAAPAWTGSAGPTALPGSWGWQAPGYGTVQPAPPFADPVTPPGGPHRPKKLIFLLAGIGVAILITPFLIHALSAPTPASRPSAAAPSTRPGTSAPSAPSTGTSAPVPLTKRQQWLHGLTSLRAHMTAAMVSENTAVSAASLRAQGQQLRRCSPDLAGLGPPTTELRPEYRLARRACAGFEQGARCDAAAARAFASFDPTSGPDPKLTKLFHCSDAGINRGSDLISRAVGDGSVPG
jgi:hypothetical protein